MIFKINIMVTYIHWIQKVLPDATVVFSFSIIHAHAQTSVNILLIKLTLLGLINSKCIFKENWYMVGEIITHTHTVISYTNMTTQCHLELLCLALATTKNSCIDCSHTRWNLSICHNLLSCPISAYKQALIEWSQFTKTK